MNAIAARMTGRGFALLAATLVWSAAAAGPNRAAPPEPPRIVSLAPHLTELAFDAGIEDTLVGVVEWSDYPDAAGSLPRIGDAFRFDLERILRLEATHALAWGGGTPSSAIAELEALGVAVEIIEIETLDQVGDAIERLGALGGNADSAEVAAAAFRERLSRFEKRHRDPQPDVSIFYQVSERPLFTLGARHVINEVFALCGGVNVFRTLDTEAAGVDLEAVLARDPMAIVIGKSSIGESVPGETSIGGSGEPAASTRWRSYPNLRAVACDNILQVDPALLVRPTPRVLDGADKLCDWLDREVRPADNPACRIDRG